MGHDYFEGFYYHLLLLILELKSKSKQIKKGNCWKIILKKLSTRKKIGIVLLVVQVVAIMWGIISGNLDFRNIGTLLGFCLPGIIGLVLLIVKDKHTQNGNN